VNAARPAGEWRNYGPLQVDWSKIQPMGGSYVAPSLNGEGQPLYLAVNCTARKINVTSQAGQWRTWVQETPARFAQVEALGAVIALLDQFLLHQPPGQPGPAILVVISRRGIGRSQLLAEAAQVAPPLPPQRFQQHRRRRRPVAPRRSATAVGAAAVAAAAGGHDLAHRQQQGLFPAALPLGHGLHAAHLALGLLQPLLIGRRGGRPRHPASGADRPAQADPVSRIKQHQAVGRQAIAAGPPRFLQVALRAGRQIQVQHQAHIGPVHPHAEGHRGHQHRPGLVLKVAEGQLAALRIHAGVISDRLHPSSIQPLGPLLHGTAGAGVDQHRPAGPGNRLKEIRQGIGRPAPHGVGEVAAPG
jgi:hypothetical protein